MMKLVMAIVSSDDSRSVLEELADGGFAATVTSSTGGFLRISNTTIFCGVEDSDVDKVLAILRVCCAEREEPPTAVPAAKSGLATSVAMTPKKMGRATIFVLDVAHFEQV